MRISHLDEGVGRIIKGVNTTVDVGVDQTSIEASKFGNKVDKDGKPPTLSSKVKGASTNVAFNLGLTEGYKLQLERDKELLVLHIKNTETGNRTEVRGKPGYETNYDPNDDLHQLLDTIGKSANISDLMNGEVVGINPGHPDGSKAKAATTKAYNEERFTAMEWACIEGGHELPERPQRKMSAIMEQLVAYELSEALGELDPSTEIYVDMDGVLADFFGEWAKVMGKKSFRDIEDPASAIKKIKTVEDFWLNLPVLPQAKELLLLIKRVKGKYKICTSPLADDPRSEPHKREWVKKNLSFFLPEEVIVTHNKPQFAKNKNGTPNILIDDYGVNIRAWEAAGGIGFKYKDHKFERTAKAIKQAIGENLKEEKYTTAFLKKLIAKAEAMADKDFSQYTPADHAFMDKFFGYHLPNMINQFGDMAGVVQPLLQSKYYTENFADGKKKGKSRPGRVKRSGASCNGSVTDLRKRAKNASGEKAKMYHWCANMKSGRKKK